MAGQATLTFNARVRPLAAQAWTRDDLVSSAEASDEQDPANRAEYQRIYNEGVRAGHLQTASR